jgi:uncharacterized membrane protein YfcA
VAAALVGLVAGVVVGLTSTGGGALLTPALILVLGVPPSVAVGSDVMAAAVMKLFAGSAYALRGHVHWGTVARLSAGSLPGAAVGIAVLNRLPPHALDSALTRGVGAALVLAGAATLLRLRGHWKHPSEPPPFAVTAGLGFLVGALVSLTSVGSGSILLSALTVFFPLQAATLVGTDLVHALFLSSAATIGHLAAGRVDVPLALSVLAGGIPGVIIGARLALRLPERKLRAGLAFLLIALGLHLAWRTVTPATPRTAVHALLVTAEDQP